MLQLEYGEVKMRIGEVFRYTQKAVRDQMKIDGLPNYFYYTNFRTEPLVKLDSGINPIGKYSGDKITPALVISSSPHRFGSEETPWQDFFAPDRGHIRYCGDNKSPAEDPTKKAGNKALLKQFEMHNSEKMSDRANATPIIFFKKVTHGGRVKGNYEFNGFGIISSAERVVQFNKSTNSTFINYVFDFTILEMMDEGEDFSWSWINLRRDPLVSAEESLKAAPTSWREWVRKGRKSIGKLRRHVSKVQVLSTQKQKPIPGSSEFKTLDAIYNFYSKPQSKKRFENLASIVAAYVIGKNNQHYRTGWITKGSSDSGIDFVGRLDIGEGFGKAKLIVLGQAKCEKLDSPTGGTHIARTVAKLKRGWLGVYVTTSYFSEQVQLEILDDKYPLLLINGLMIAESVNEMIISQGYKDVESYLCEKDTLYEGLIRYRDPEEILLD